MHDTLPPQAPLDNACAYHPGKQAVARCVSCGLLVCSDCRAIRWNRNYCPSCAGEYSGWYAQPGSPPPYAPPPVTRARKVREVVFPGAPWGVGEAMIIFAIAFTVASVASLFLYGFLRTVTSTTNAVFLLLFFSSVLLYTLLLAGTFFSVRVRHGSTATALGLKLEGLGKGLGLGLVIGVPLFLGAMGLAYVSQQLLRDTSSPDMVSRSIDEVSSGGVSAVFVFILFLTLVILAPVCEEIFFRGYLYPALRNRMDRQPAMIINGLLFAAVHFELIGFLPRLLLGYGLCYIYERQHNLSGPITGHALYNGTILLLSGLLGAL